MRLVKNEWEKKCDQVLIDAENEKVFVRKK